jgi:hypothetical protein
LADIVMQLLEKKPEHRPRSAQEVQRRLRALTDVPAWCPDAAAEWWQTNLPETAARIQPLLDDNTPTSGAVHSPVGAQQAR